MEYNKLEEEQKRKHIEQWRANGGGKSIVSGFSMSKVFGAVRPLFPFPFILFSVTLQLQLQLYLLTCH